MITEQTIRTPNFAGDVEDGKPSRMTGAVNGSRYREMDATNGVVKEYRYNESKDEWVPDDAASAAEAYADAAEAAAERAEEAAASVGLVDYAYLDANAAGEAQVTLCGDKTATPGAIVTFADGAAVPAKSATIAIKPVQAGSGDPSPTNIRPITGHTEANITVNGVNQFGEDWTANKAINASTGVVIDYAGRSVDANYYPVLPGAQYYCGTSFDAGLYALTVFEYGLAGDYIKSTAVNRSTLTTTANTYFVRFVITTATDLSSIKTSVNYPATDTAYHAYTGRTVAVDWTDEAGTVYGGTLVYMGGGKWRLTQTRRGSAMDALSWTRTTTQTYPVYICNDFLGVAKGTAGEITTISSVLKPVADATTTNIGNNSANNILCISPTGTNAGRINVRFDGDSDEWSSAISGQTVVFNLATPLVYDLTADELATLLGNNVIFADTGDIEELTYRTSENSRTIVLGTGLDGLFEAQDGIITSVENRVPEPPAADGDYKLTATVADGVVSYSWTEEA